MCQEYNNTKSKKGKHLNYEERQSIERWCNRDKRRKKARTQEYYAHPYSLGGRGSNENALSKTISTVMPVIAELYKRVRNEISNNEGVTIAFIADFATVAKNPKNLKATNFNMKLVGSDFKFEKREVV